MGKKHASQYANFGSLRNAYLVRQKQCQQKQRSQYVPSLTQFLG